MTNYWRLIPYAVQSAAENMAIDEAILDAHLSGLVPPTLRVYGWEPRAVSIGYGQKLSETVESRIKARGYDVVRRPTGGRAVLHDFELTYSFVGSAGGADDGALSESVIVAYKQICQGLIHAFKGLGVDLELGESSSNYKDAQDCFLATTSADLHYQGKKMIGSAQLRRKSAVLQHGSILLNQPQHLMAQLLSDPASVPNMDVIRDTTGSHTDAANDTDNGSCHVTANDTAVETAADTQRHANLFEIVGEKVKINRLEDALMLGFERAFFHPFRDESLTSEEMHMAQQYRARYQHAREQAAS